MDYTAKQLARLHFSGELEDLLSHYAKYKSEYDQIADRLMENQPTHDFFFNWLGSKGLDKQQALLTCLDEQGVQIMDNYRPAFEFDRGVSIVEL